MRSLFNHDTNLPFVRWRVLITLCFSLLAVMLANSSLNMALPAIAEEMSLTQLELTWVVEAYALVFAGLLFIGSAVADRYGRKRVMQIGLFLFGLASLYAGIMADNGTTLLAARAAMGLAAAFVMPTTLSVVNVTFPKNERAKAIAIWGAIAGAGMMLGSVITGVLLNYFSWHSTFILSGVMAVLAIGFNFVFVNESVDEEHTPIDWLGGLFITVGLVGVIFTIMEAPNAEGDWWHHTEIVIALALGVLGLIAFIIRELRTDHPMLDVRLFKNPIFAVSAGVLVLVFLSLMGSFLNISQVMQLVLGYSAFKASLLFLPVMLPLVLISPIVPKLVKKIGLKPIMLIGLVTIIAGMILMSLWDENVTFVDIMIGLGTTLAGMAFVMTPATNLLMSEVPANRSGMGSALNDTTRELGGALGVAILGSIISSNFTTFFNNNTPAGLTAEQSEFASSSLANSLHVATETQNPEMIILAHEGFMNSISAAMHISVIITVITLIAAAIWLPRGVKELAETHH